MRNNSVCDALCNNKACGYDGGECPVPNQTLASSAVPASTVPDAHSTFDNAKFDSTSILRTAESPVLAAIHLHAAAVIAQYDERLLKPSTTGTRRSGAVASSTPTTIRCSASSVQEQRSFIMAGNVDVTVQSDCTGLSSCKSCGSCGICGPTGCDTSFFDGFCRMNGASWACASVTPSASNNFSSTTCVDTAASKTQTPTVASNAAASGSSAQTLTPGAIAGITIAIVVAVLLVAAAAIYRLKRRSADPNAPLSNLVETQVNREMVSVEINPALN